MKRLFWAGHQDMGGILVVADNERDAMLKAHSETCCECDEEEEDCFASGDWGTVDVAQEIKPFRLRLVERKETGPPTPIKADGLRLWWLATELSGCFVVAASKDDAIAQSIDADGGDQSYWDFVTPIRQVDGFDMLVEEGRE